MQEEYTNDKKLCEWLRANSSGIYRLTGLAADKIEQLKEELETLRAEHESIDDKLQAQMYLVGSLLEENAKLIAERVELIHDRDMLKMCADHYEDELKRMHAERDEGQKILDCKFGDNIVWFLREFENAEKEYLEEGCLEIYGEDANGREGSCEITVNEICREAANVIEKLLAEREAMMKQTHKRADELLVGDHIKKYGEVIKIFQITNNGGYIKINFEEAHLPPEAIIEMAYVPLPAQQIPEVTLPEKKLVPDPDIPIQAWDGDDFENCAYNNAIDDMAEILINQGYAIRKPTKR